MKTIVSSLLRFIVVFVLSIFPGLVFATGLLPGGYDVTKLPKPLPYTYGGVTYTHAIAFPHTGSDDHWVAYYNGSITWSWPWLMLPQETVCFYQDSQNGPTSGDPNANCGGVPLVYNECTKTYYSDVDIVSPGNATLYAAGGCGNINYTTNDVVIEGQPYNVTTSLRWPLSGTFASRTVGWRFGTTWTPGQCPSGTYKKHAGVDVNATANEAVYAAHDGIVKAIHYQSPWAYGIVIEDSSGLFTTVSWHVNAYGGLAVNDTVTRGQQIATVANLVDPNPPYDNITHFHFGIRMGSYSDPESYAGSLPVANGCGYLAYPESFIDPESATYQ